MLTQTLVFVDIVDSTALAQRLGDDGVAALWSRHDQRARRLLDAHSGREIDRADGFFLLFDTVRDAAAFAVDYHAELKSLAMKARVGIHTGPVSLRENSAKDIARGAKRIEVEGVAKPFAARIMALARGGQTLLSASSVAALEGPPSASTRSHGHYRLKGIAEPAEIFELASSDDGGLGPPIDNDKAHRVVRIGGLWQPTTPVPNNLPAERDAFVGRARELRSLAARFDAGQRLVTLVGPGGTGKTRLALRYGREWLGEWPGGAFFCDLSEARSLGGICNAAAYALGVSLGRSDPVERLGHAIAGRGRCLVVLDNFEQVIEHGPETVGRWLDRAARACFLTTSREGLHLPGEQLLAVEPLPLGDDAVELFALRARAQREEFVVDHSNSAAVAEVVRLLDGLPLAIELAAARSRLLSPAQLVARLRDRFSLLAGARGPMARQATLRAAIDWSWELLSPWEQAALAQSSVFEGGFSLDAAERLYDLTPWPAAPSPMAVLQALLDKNLLRRLPQTRTERYEIDEPYFGMYVSIHEYARERLGEMGQAASDALVRHGRLYAELGTHEAVERLWRHGGVRLRRALELELENLVAACRRAVRRGDAEVAALAYCAAWEVLELRGPYQFGMALGEEAAAVRDPLPALRAAVSACRGRAAAHSGRYEDAAVLFEDAAAIYRDLGMGARSAAVANLQGDLLREQGRLDECRTQLEEALAAARSAGDRVTEGRALANLATLDHQQGQVDLARGRYEAALAIHRDVGNRENEAATLGNLASLEHEQGHIEEARRLHDTAIAVARDVGDRASEAASLGNLGNLLTDQGRLDEALAQQLAALTIHRETGNRKDEAIVLGNIGILNEQRDAPERARADFEAALAIAHEIGNRRHEGYLLATLGNLHAGQGGHDIAVEHFEKALPITRALGDKRTEGFLFGALGRLRFAQQRLDEALADIDRGAALLKSLGERVELAKLACDRARIHWARGEAGAARAARADAWSAATELGVGPDSELRREIDQLDGILR